MIAVTMPTPADGPSFGHGAFGQVDVNVLAREEARLDAVAGRARLHEREGGLHRFLHHLAELAGGLDEPLPGTVTASMVSSSPPLRSRQGR
jgi:hypothetical protein